MTRARGRRQIAWLLFLFSFLGAHPLLACGGEGDATSQQVRPLPGVAGSGSNARPGQSAAQGLGRGVEEPEESPPSPLSPEERADLEALRGLLGSATDPVADRLPAVDEAVEQDLPVRAAGILKGDVLPASAAFLARLNALSLGSEYGRGLRSTWVAAYEKRAAALTAYAAALERGIVEDLVLADALRDQRAAGESILGAWAEYRAGLRRIDASGEGE